MTKPTDDCPFDFDEEEEADARVVKPAAPRPFPPLLMPLLMVTGAVGAPMFDIGDPRAFGSTLNTGNAVLGAALIDGTQVSGGDYEINYDVSSFLDASIEKVVHTLGEQPRAALHPRRLGDGRGNGRARAGTGGTAAAPTRSGPPGCAAGTAAPPG